MLYKLLSILSLLISPVLSWGPQGHIAVANVAQSLISSNTYNSISGLIPNGNMSSVANWADEVRTLPEWKWSAPLHFINTPSWNCSYIRERDCYNDANNFLYCVDGAIQNYTNLLYSSPEPDYLKFLIHFVGDIHQPLHCGFIGDRGGNDIIGHFYDKKTNLHSVWDSGIIEKRLQTDFSYSPILWQDYIIKNIVPNIGKDKCINCSSLWGEESIVNACDYSYVDADKNKIQNDFKLGDSYYKRVINIVEKQIAKASVRLANLLNFIYS